MLAFSVPRGLLPKQYKLPNLQLLYNPSTSPWGQRLTKKCDEIGVEWQTWINERGRYQGKGVNIDAFLLNFLHLAVDKLQEED